jgi:hypothetical protein
LGLSPLIPLFLPDSASKGRFDHPGDPVCGSYCSALIHPLKEEEKERFSFVL